MRRFKRVPKKNVGVAIKQIAKKLAQSCVVDEGKPAFPVNIDENVDVTVRPRFVPCQGTDQRQMNDASLPQGWSMTTEPGDRLIANRCSIAHGRSSSR